jgi:DNA polymerase I-like protein with 3'-5' exonuclease and polymerase domains
MLVNVDAKGLEWVAALALSRDRTGIDEYNAGFDIHTDNQTRLALPTRVVAKNFLFRSIYADEASGGAFAFAHDPKFTHVSRSQRVWQARIDTFYNKYTGLKQWHVHLMEVVGSTGVWTNPTGATYVFNKKAKYNGDLEWPKTQIYNYPVQGLGADIMAVVRASLRKRLMRAGMSGYAVVTVHDSILFDLPKEKVYDVCDVIDGAFKDARKNIQRMFQWDLGLELKGEIGIGPNWGNLVELKRNTDAYPDSHGWYPASEDSKDWQVLHGCAN